MQQQKLKLSGVVDCRLDDDADADVAAAVKIQWLQIAS